VTPVERGFHGGMRKTNFCHVGLRSVGKGLFGGRGYMSPVAGLQLSTVSARTAYAVAASLMNRPTLDVGSRFLFREYAGQKPAALS